MNRDFFLKKLQKSKVLKFYEDLKEADALQQQGFFTSSFLRYWQVVESVSRELMVQYRACGEADEIGEKICGKLIKQNIDINANSLKSQLYDVLYSSAKKRAGESAKYINVSVIESAVADLSLKYDTDKLRYLLSSQLNKGASIPVGIVLRKTIRTQRNDIIHKNGNLSREELEEIKPIIQHFFDLVDQIKEQKV